MHEGLHVAGVSLALLEGALGFGLLAAAGLWLFWLLCVLMTLRVLTRPPRRTYASALARGKPGDPSELEVARAFRAWNFEHDGHVLPAWDIDGDRKADSCAPVAVLVHGWGDAKVGSLPRLAGVVGWAGRVIAFDLPGHGESSRGGTTLGVRDPECAAALVRASVEPGRAVILFGWSLGAGAAIAAAVDLVAGGTNVVGVIAENPYRAAFTPARNVLRFYAMPWRFTLAPALALVGLRLGVGAGRGGRSWRGFDRAEQAARLGCPLLVLAGERDEICPPQDGREIAAAAPAGRFVLIPGKGHNDLWSGDAGHAIRGISEWVEGLKAPVENMAIARPTA